MSAARPFDIPRKLVAAAFRAVKSNAGGAGIDKETIGQFESKLGDNLYKIWNRMSSGTYFPPPVKAVAIPKKSGGERVLGVPIRSSYCTLLSLALGGCRKTGGVGNPFAQRMVRFGGDGNGVGHSGLLSMSRDEAFADPFIDHPMRYAVTLLDLGDTQRSARA